MNLLNAVHLAGAAHGLLLSLVLARTERNRAANRLLALALLAFSIMLLSTVYQSAGWYHVAPHLFGVAYPMPFLFAPALYLYVKVAAQGRATLRPRDIGLFLPFVATLAYGLPIYSLKGQEKIALYEALLRGAGPRDLAAIDILKIVYGVACTAMSLRLLQRHTRRVKGGCSELEGAGLAWLRRMVVAGAAVWCLALALEAITLSGLGRVGGFDDIVSLAVAVVVYGIGYMALRQPEVFVWAPQEDGRPPDDVRRAPRYEKSGLSADDAAERRARLERWMMERKPYLKNDLTLPELASAVSMSPHNLSEIINTVFEQNFYDFVNNYRVEEVKAQLEDPKQRSLPLLTVALNAGFNSKSSFNAVFKKRIGITPSEYRDRLRASG